jgi:hypothetical protein
MNRYLALNFGRFQYEKLEISTRVSVGRKHKHIPVTLPLERLEAPQMEDKANT